MKASRRFNRETLKLRSGVSVPSRIEAGKFHMSDRTDGAPLVVGGSELRVCLIAALYMLSGLALLGWDNRGIHQNTKPLIRVSQFR